MPTFRQADPDDLRLLEQVIAEWHPHLREHGVTINLLYVHATRDERTGEPKGPALKLHGYPAQAIVKINSLQQRAEGLTDATIRLDGDNVESWTLAYKRAILDHEAEHIEILSDDDGNAQVDDAGRPRLRIRPHDSQIGVFYNVAKRHGDVSAEVQAMRSLDKDFVQGCFSYG